jgi:hypothetical protein
MKHAGPEALDTLDALLRDLRKLPFLVEKSRGVFYRSSQAFLHVHEDPSGMHADLRVGDDFDRYRVQTKSEQARLLALVRRS